MLHHEDGTADAEGGCTMMPMASAMMVMMKKMRKQ